MGVKPLTSALQVFAALAITLAFGVIAWAMPGYQDALFAQYPNAAASLPNCVACHASPGSISLNSFGDAFLSNGLVFDGSLEALDSDGDGATNGDELKASPATGPGDPSTKPGSGGPPSPPPPPVTEGATLYANYCAACHGALPGSSKSGATLARVQGAITGNAGGMGYLATLSTTQLEAIVSALAPATAPTSSPNYTGMWWNPSESGWGINVNHQGDVVFATLFTYDQAGVPLWLLMSGPVQADGKTFTGTLYRTRGPAFNAEPFAPLTAANLTNVGTMSITFSSVSSGSISYTYQGVAVAKAIVQQVFGAAAASCRTTTGSRTALTNYQDMWWNPAESGWGVNIVHQDNILFATLFTYDLAGNNLWLVMSGATRQQDGSYLGALYRTRGPAFNAQPFTPLTAADVTSVGTMRFAFADGVTGSLAYSVDGITVSKSITRQVFASPVPACASSAAPSPPATDGATLYANYCAACHGALASSSKGGATLARVQGAITGNVGGMGYLSTLSTTQLEAVVAVLTAVVPGAGPVCGTCHAIPPSTGAHARHDSRYSCNSCHDGYNATSVNAATHNNGTRNVSANAGWNAGTMSCSNACHGTASWSPTATLSCTSCHGTPPPTGDHANHNLRFSCNSCHDGYNATTVNAATHNNGTRNVSANAGWNAGTMSCSNSCHGTGLWSPTATLGCSSCHGTPPGTGAHGKHDLRYACSTCHGSGYSSTTVNAPTHNNGTRELITSVGWNIANRSCSNSCHGTGVWSPTATLACSSCHGIPPSTGKHSKHRSRSCRDCHGPGYSSTTVNTATHINNVKEVIASTGWSATARTCSNSCHGRESW